MLGEESVVSTSMMELLMCVLLRNWPRNADGNIVVDSNLLAYLDSYHVTEHEDFNLEEGEIFTVRGSPGDILARGALLLRRWRKEHRDPRSMRT